jgi:glycosyltransferase involved in cell wall biosynthesis
VREAVRRFTPDLIYCHGNDGVGFQVYHTALSCGVPTLTTVGDSWLASAWRDLARYDPWHAVASGRSQSLWKRRVKAVIRAFGRVAGCHLSERPQVFGPVMVISTFLHRDLAQSGAPIGAHKVDVCRPILPERFFTPGGAAIGRPPGRTPALRALFVGRIELLKGPDTALAAVARAVAGGVDVTLTVAGLEVDDTRRVLEAQADKLGLSNRVHWVGTPSDDVLIHLYQTHDVLLFPSRIVEGFGLVTAEAMACGMPVIGSVRSGAADIIRAGETGFAVDPEDVPGIARAITRLATDSDLLERLAAAAMMAATEHHPDSVIARIESAIELSIARGAN